MTGPRLAFGVRQKQGIGGMARHWHPCRLFPVCGGSERISLLAWPASSQCVIAMHCKCGSIIIVAVRAAQQRQQFYTLSWDIMRFQKRKVKSIPAHSSGSSIWAEPRCIEATQERECAGLINFHYSYYWNENECGKWEKNNKSSFYEVSRRGARVTAETAMKPLKPWEPAKQAASLNSIRPGRLAWKCMSKFRQQ